jgi:hypothetical protein
MRGVFDRNLRATHMYQRSRVQFLGDAWAQGFERGDLSRRDSRAAWFTRDSRKVLRSRKPADVGPPMRSVELVLLKAARRLQLWRGKRSAARRTPG